MHLDYDKSFCYKQAKIKHSLTLRRETKPIWTRSDFETPQFPLLGWKLIFKIWATDPGWVASWQGSSWTWWYQTVRSLQNSIEFVALREITNANLGFEWWKSLHSLRLVKQCRSIALNLEVRSLHVALSEHFCCEIKMTTLP